MSHPTFIAYDYEKSTREWMKQMKKVLDRVAAAKKQQTEVQ